MSHQIKGHAKKIKMALPTSTSGDSSAAAAAADVSASVTGAVDAQAARKEAVDAEGNYHVWVLSLGIKDRNKLIQTLQLNAEEKATLINAVRKYKQWLSKRKYVDFDL